MTRTRRHRCQALQRCNNDVADANDNHHVLGNSTKMISLSAGLPCSKRPPTCLLIRTKHRSRNAHKSEGARHLSKARVAAKDASCHDNFIQSTPHLPHAALW